MKTKENNNAHFANSQEHLFSFWELTLMGTFKFQPEDDNTAVLDRIIEAYGFSSKAMLAIHFEMAASSLSGRYRRPGFPADMVVRCLAETGVSLEWLVTGKGSKFEGQSSDILRLDNYKIIDGELIHADSLLIDKVIFFGNTPLPSNPISVFINKCYYVIDKKFDDIFDGNWFIKIDGKYSVRKLTRMPMKKVRISNQDTSFDCELSDIEIIGRVVAEIKVS
ncbi:phage repressor protein CI [Proteus mirabilis]|nr:phage repressor protein CI [Proteus mirabilis]